MVNAWSKVDALQAEAQLRGLRRRLAELDAALTDQQVLFREYPNSFSLSLGIKSLTRIGDSLRQELISVLRNRENERLEFRLAGGQFVGNSARFSDLGSILTRVQRLYTSIAQAITSGPTLRGPVPAAVRNATDLRLEAVFPSSFGMSVYVPSNYNVMGISIASDALEQLFQLLGASQDERRLLPVSGAIGRRALNHLRSLATLLNNTTSRMDVQWKDFSGTQFEWSISEETAVSIIRSIDNINMIRSEEREFVGFLVGASLIRNTFELIKDDGVVISGKYVSGLGSVIMNSFGRRIRASLDETEVIDRISGESRTFFALRTVEQA